VETSVIPGQKGDFRVIVAGKVVIDKARDASDFTTLNASLCPDGLVKPWPKPHAADRVASAIEMATASAQ
jgi:hypothetical protein